MQVPGGYIPLNPLQGAGAGAGMPPPPPDSYEGSPQRCFKQMFVCSQGINITSWPLHGLGQHLVRHYASQLQSAAAVASEAVVAPQQHQHQPAGRDGSNAGVLPSSSSSGSEQVLRVIFHKRASADRQLLNVRELVQQCNAWRHTTAAGRHVRGSCREVRTVADAVQNIGWEG